MKAVFRIVNALLAAAVFPVTLFLDTFFIQVSPSIGSKGVEESINLKRIIDIFSGNDRLSTFLLKDGSFTWPEAFAPVTGRLIAAIAALAVILVIAIFIIVWSCCSKKGLPVIIAAVLGIISCIVMIACFNSAAAEFTSGAISLASAFGTGLLTTLIGGFFGVDTLILGGFQNGLIIVFIAIIVWAGAFMLVDLGADDAEKEEKK